ncbi:ectonucleotide pyrophosphatase/phosphodiesterase family member 5 [Clonorchis sinensis]|uniref:Ectonucleotide pyrophosphatase/phosphodiesterase family member 5 n=1 Tax=Clonorchis sinensis TaxID=79923 RepID=G7Y4X9_CLOSI|nr:ectonucleotide pyrophosphatase/phosphodiesterase family member 5 [Clonorchis sinensis]
MDGFRHDYLELVRLRLGQDSLPNFARLEADGVRANRSINAFPTVTMPNHHTLVTGLYPQDSGVVDNSMFDSHWPNETFDMGSQKSLNEAPWLDGWPEPIWVTLQRKGGLAGSLLWPLTDNFVNGDLPFQQVSQFTTLDGSVRYPYTKRVKDLLWWLDNPRYQIDLVLAYFDEPDETGHAYGPESKEVAEVIVELDKALGQLLDGLEARDLRDKVDIILTADHGMTWITRDRVIVIDDLLDPADYSTTEFSSVGLIYPKPGKEDEVYSKLHGAHPHLKVHWLSDTPSVLRFNHTNSRMPAIVLLPDPLWHLVHRRNESGEGGIHGYSPEFADMNPFLIASGPSFRKHEVVDQVYAIDIYTLMCWLLRVRPSANNGSLDRIANSLLKPEVAERLLSFEHWPEWFVWMAIELELMWFFMVVIVIASTATALGVSLHMQRRYSRLAEHSRDQYEVETMDCVYHIGHHDCTSVYVEQTAGELHSTMAEHKKQLKRLTRNSGHPIDFLWDLMRVNIEIDEVVYHRSTMHCRIHFSVTRLGQPDSISALVFPSDGMAARHRKGVTTERFFSVTEISGIRNSNTDDCLHYLLRMLSYQSILRYQFEDNVAPYSFAYTDGIESWQKTASTTLISELKHSYSVVRLLEKDVGLATTSSYLKTSGRPNYQMSLRFSGTTRSSVTRIAVLNTTLPEYTGFQAKLATLMGFDSVFG